MTTALPFALAVAPLASFFWAVLGSISSGDAGALCRHLGGGFIFPQALERGLPHHASAGPAGKLDLGHEFGFDPRHVRGAFGCILALKWALVRRESAELLEEAPCIALVKPCSDPTRVDEVVALVHADQEGAQVAGAAAPAADDDFVARAAFGFYPGLGTPRPIGGVSYASR